MEVVELAAAEVRRDAGAAVQPNGPEVVRRDGLVADDDRGDAIKIEILEAHCEPEIAFFQEDKPCSPLMFNKFALVGSVRARTTLSPEDT